MCTRSRPSNFEISLDRSPPLLYTVYDNLLIVKGVKPIWLKILISIGMLAAAFLLCFLIGSMIVNALTQ